jgi:ATP-dependent DNA helicase PIF1
MPIVQFACGEKLTMQLEKWSFKSFGGLVLSRRQIPLKLAWAISIHKSQVLLCIVTCLFSSFLTIEPDSLINAASGLI